MKKKHLLLLFLTTLYSPNIIKEYKKTYPLNRQKSFSLPSLKTKNFSLPPFKVKNNHIPPQIQRKLMIPGAPGGDVKAPAPVIAPIQFPGILNPTIYLQNTQSAPIFPQLNAPPVNVNVHVNGLESYYKPKPVIVHEHTNVMNQVNGNSLGRLVKNIENERRYKKRMSEDVKRKEHLVVQVSPEIAENPEELLDSQRKVFLNDVLDPVQKAYKENEVRDLVLQVDRNLRLLKREYEEVGRVTDVEFKKLQDRYDEIKERKIRNMENYPDGRIDMGFLGS